MPKPRGTATWRDLRLGIVVAAVALAAVLIVLFLGTTRGPFAPPTYPLVLELDDAAGIRVGSFVRVGGMAAGEVTALDLVPRETPPPTIRGDTLLPAPEFVLHPTDIRLELAVQERFRRYITASSRAQLANLGLGGDRYVRITAGDVREPPLPPGARIEEIPSVDLDLVAARAARAVNEMQVIAVQMAEIREKTLRGGGTAGRLLEVEAPLYASLERLGDESEAMLELLDRGEGAIPRYMAGGALQESLDRLGDDVDAIDSLAGEGPLARWADPVELERAVADLSAEVDDLSRRLDAGEGSLGRLVSDEELYLRVRVLQTRIAELMAALRADPLGSVDIDLF